MPCDARGRAYRKYYDDIYSLESNLQTVTDEGNVTTHGIQVFDSVDVDGFFFGDAGFVTNVPSNPGVPNLQTVTGYGPSTSDKVSFSDVYADGNVIINGKVTCSELIGNGEFLGDVANVYELSVLDSKITATESNIIITNTSGLTDVTKGDLLVSTNDGVLDRLTIGSTDQVLLANITSNQPEWVDVDFPDITGDIPDRLDSMEQNVVFTNTNTISSLATGDILYAEDTNKLVNLERETRADNTFLTSGAYGTGWGRLLRVNYDIGNSDTTVWLHPTSNLTSNIVSQYSAQYSSAEGNPIVIESDITEPDDRIILFFDGDIYQYYVDYRIDVQNVYLGDKGIKFGFDMFYSELGEEYTDFSYETKHPTGAIYNLYILGLLIAASDRSNTSTYKFLHGDGSNLLIQNGIAPPSDNEISPFPPIIIGKRGYLDVFSDKRLKNKITEMTHALDKLSRLVPKLYDKDGKRESGFIAQEMYYDVREMRHIVWPDRDANPNEDVPEPDYSDWGKRPACLRYLHFVAYVVKSIQELKERIERLKNNKK